ncbi:hypothetical protein [Salibacterium salarium]|uniref:hypothetical protein n=1 Tax=Salibacterium salarium TaxID=284579 RepID=UPI000F79A85C|nr:hypothetical protein [Salibacterium salarium]
MENYYVLHKQTYTISDKVVTLYQGANDTVAALDIEPIGMAKSWTQQPIYEYLRDDLEGTEIIGQETQPNLEEIAEINLLLLKHDTRRYMMTCLPSHQPS